MAEAEGRMLNTWAAVLFGLAPPPPVPHGAPRQRFCVADGEADEEEGAPAPQTPTMFAKARERRVGLLRWLRAGGERLTNDAADAMCVTNTCAYNDLRALQTQGKVKVRLEWVRGKELAFWRATP